MIYRGPGFSPSYDSTPPPVTSPASKFDRRHIIKLRKRVNLLTVEEEGRARSYDGKIAWSSINHSLLSGAMYTYLHTNIFTPLAFHNRYGKMEKIEFCKW